MDDVLTLLKYLHHERLDISRTGYEQMRLGGFIAAAPHLPKKIKGPKDIIRFHWEKDEIKEMSRRTLARLRAMDLDPRFPDKLN